jgi:hypothetical protein
MPIGARCARPALNLLIPLIIEDDSTYVPSKGWAEMIRKVYEVDPMVCSKCGGTMNSAASGISDAIRVARPRAQAVLDIF